ncbi:uncharacterized protein LOC130813404 [Amaranthus tricolor]|uniref:uncharacterized protein LOC130813404 n=1 Tax=Amaranthus tricolor TaxID=29722 RepID=UPI00258DEB05|nr:uncharacterized protein LOC130813404 [Amaranthus tricolor]
MTHDELHANQQFEIAHNIAHEGTKTGKGLNQIGNLQRATDTQWSSHLNSITSLMRTFSATGKVLKTVIKKGNSEKRASADAAYECLISFEFVFILHLMGELLGLTDNLFQALQRRGQDILNAICSVSSTKVFVQMFRANGWDELFIKAKSFCKKHNVEIPNVTAHHKPGKGRSHQGGNITMVHHFRVDLFIAVTDALPQELDHRFDENMIDLLFFSASLDPKDSFKSFDIDKICNLENKYLTEDFSD